MQETEIKLSELINPTVKQKEFLTATDNFKYPFYGGAKGGGKSYILRWGLVRKLLKWARKGIKNVHTALFCEDYPALKDRQITKIEAEFPPWLGTLSNSQTEGMAFVLRPEYGRGVIALRNLDDPSKYASSEFAVAAVDELTKNERRVFDQLRSIVRWTGIEDTGLWGASNPGDIGHDWVKKLWITRELTDEDPKQEELVFIKSLPFDNPHLAKSYIEELKRLPEKLRQAYLEGNWDVFEGQFFSEFDRDVHVVEPFSIPQSWFKFRSIDPSGRAGITSCHWYALDWNKRVFVYKEHYGLGLDADQHAKEIVRLSEGENYRYTVIDSAAFAKMGLPETMAELYMRLGVMGLVPSSKQRVTGWNIVHQYLRFNQTEFPKLQIFSTCPNLIRTLPMLVHDDLHPEDLNCFIAGTKVATINGEKNIENVKVGELVETPIGYKKVIWAGISGISPVMTIKLSNGKQLCGTPNHKIFIKGKGLIELRSLKIGGVIQERIDISKLWQLKKLFIMGCRIGEDIIQVISRQKENILNWVTNNSIVKFILIILGKFRKEMIFTIKTIIQTIIPQKILLRCQDTNIASTTTIFFNQKPVRRDTNGIIRLKEERYCEKMPKKCEIEHQNEGYRAEIVKLLLQREVLLGLYVKNVKSLKDILRKLVRFVRKNLCTLEGQQHKPVHISAVGCSEKEMPVYNLTVDEAHLYYANGVLATNTKGEDHAVDELRYFLQTLREGNTERPMTNIERRLLEIKNSEFDFNLNYNKNRSF